MNERIRELSKQAWEWADQQEYKDPTQEFSDILEQKFAELIVAECCSVNRKTLNKIADMDGRDYLNAGFWLDIELKEHFGVEE